MKVLLSFILSVCLCGSLQAANLRIATWNIYWLGDQKNNRTDADYIELQSYAKTLNADVIALCSGQVKLATDLYSSQYLFSDSFGAKAPLWL